MPIRSRLLQLSLVSLTALAALAQTPPAASVRIPVVVTDRSGQPVVRLPREAFQVREKGTLRALDVFAEVTAKTADAAQIEPPRPGRANFLSPSSQGTRLTIVVLDRLNPGTVDLTHIEDAFRGGQTPLTRRDPSYTLNLLGKVLPAQLPADQPVAIYGLTEDGLQELHAFQDSTVILREALPHVELHVGPHAIADWTPAPGTSAEWHRQAYQTAQRLSDFISTRTMRQNYGNARQNFSAQARLTLTALDQIAAATAAVPNRKSMLWVGGSLPFLVDGSLNHLLLISARQFDTTMNRLNRAQIAAYPIGYQGGAFNTSVQSFADQTGGRACVNFDEPALCLERALSDSRSYYLLGYPLSPRESKPGWHKLRVEVNAPDGKVLAREGYYLGETVADSPKHRQQELQDSIMAPVDFSGLRLSVRPLEEGQAPWPNNGSKNSASAAQQRSFEVAILDAATTGNTHLDLTALVVAFNGRRKNSGQAERQITLDIAPDKQPLLRRTGIRTQLALALAPGSYTLKFAVRDNLTGELGTVSYPLTVQ